MAGCDGWIIIKILELLFAIFCMIYKRVTDDEANKLFYFLQKYSREWPLLNNVTWEENGAIFTDITYGGYIIIIIGLIIGQCSGELQRCRKTENFFLIVGALLFIAAGSLELAALESVEERLVDNAAILGVFSLITGFLFVIDLLSASKRRKRENIKIIQTKTQSKLTQTEEKKPAETIKASDLNGNIQNGRPYSFVDMNNGTRIPRNGVKLLPSSPVLMDIKNGDPNGMAYTEPPVIDSSELKTHEGRIKSTESFLRSEKGLYPKFRQTVEQTQSSNFFIPPGYVLVPSDQLQLKSKPKSDSGLGESPTPPGYAKIIPDAKVKQGYVIIPIDQNESRMDGSRKLPSQIVKGAKEIYYVDGRSSKSPKLQRSASNLNSSDVSDLEEPRHDDRYKYEGRRKNQKFPHEYLELDPKGRKYLQPSEDSSDEAKLSYPGEVLFRPDSQPSLRSLQGSKEWRPFPKGKINEGFSDDKDNDFLSFSRRSSPYRSRASSPEKPKSILRFDHGRSSKREGDLHFPKDIRYDSLDSRKIAEDLRNLREITSSDLDLTRNLEKENKLLKERLKLEKEKLKLEMEDRLKMEQQLKDSEEEKNRRISEREEQYFGIKDLKQSHKESSLEAAPKLKHPENYVTKEEEKVGKGAREINERLKEKYLEHENKAAKEAQEFRDLIDERFHFLHEEDSSKKRKGMTSPERSEAAFSETRSRPESIDKFKSKTSKTDSDETNYSQSTDEEIRLRVETPGSASYKSEALFWLGNDREDQTKASTPTSPTSPGYVLYTAKNWPDNPSPEDRFQFSAKDAQQLKIGSPLKTPLPEGPISGFSEEKKSSHKQRLLDFEEGEREERKLAGHRKGLLVRKVDFPKEPVVEIKRPTTVTGSTSTWRRWLQPKTKLQSARSVPN